MIQKKILKYNKIYIAVYLTIANIFLPKVLFRVKRINFVFIKITNEGPIQKLSITVFGKFSSCKTPLRLIKI